MLKVISFDLDDTLSDFGFDKLLWDIEIPKAYARETGLSFEDASKHVQEEYARLWERSAGVVS